MVLHGGKPEKKHEAWSSTLKIKLIQLHLSINDLNLPLYNQIVSHGHGSNGLDATNLCCKLLQDMRVFRTTSCCLNCKNLPHLPHIPTTYRASTISFCYPANIKFQHINWHPLGQDGYCGRKLIGLQWQIQSG